MPADFDTSPGIHAMLYRYRPSRRPGQRIISLESPDSFDRDLIEAVARELDVPAAAASLDAGEVAALATAADSARRRFGDDAGVSLALQRLLTSRGGALDAEIALVAITGHAHHGGILKTFPGMVGSAAMIEAIIEGAPLGAGAGLHHRIDVNALVIRHLDQARRAIPVAETRWDDLLPTYIVAAMAQGLGWTRWVKLFATLSDNAEIADDTDPSDPETRQWETDDSLRMRREALAEILPDHAVRKVARLVLDLRGVLANSGPDVRLVYLQRLRSAIGDDDDLRRATIEALLSRGPSRERDLVLFASTRLVETGDEAFISELVNHPIATSDTWPTSFDTRCSGRRSATARGRRRPSAPSRMVCFRLASCPPRRSIRSPGSAIAFSSG